MKKISILLVLALLLGCLAGCGTGKVYDEAAAAARVQLEDFTVQTADGSSLSLSSLLEGHQLALINLFSVENGASAAELPALAEAYAQYQDRVAVLALSAADNDTPETLKEYVEYFALPFPVASASGLNLSRYGDTVPLSILVDSHCNILAVETDSKSSAQAFSQLFDRYLAGDYRLDQCSYTVIFYDADSYEQIPGCEATFTLDGNSASVTSDASGVAVFTGTPGVYQVRAISAPEGYKIIAYGSYETAPYDSVHYVALEKTAS